MRICSRASLSAAVLMFGFASFGLQAAPSSSANGKSTGWKVLTKEPSRADLFSIIREASLKEQDALQPGGRVLPSSFKLPSDATYDEIADRPRVNSIFGIDISHHTGKSIRIDKLWGQRVRFVYAKATQGVGFKDPLFEQYWKSLAKLPEGERPRRGSYHFLSYQGEGKAQAQSYLRLISQAGGSIPGDMPPVMDLEWDKATRDGPDRWKSRSPDQIIRIAREWLDEVAAKTGRKPMVYTSFQWWRERIGDERLVDRLAPYKVWVADYSKSARGVEDPRVPAGLVWHLWQFSDSAILGEGYGGKLDINIFKGTEEQFLSTFSE